MWVGLGGCFVDGNEVDDGAEAPTDSGTQTGAMTTQASEADAGTSGGDDVADSGGTTGGADAGTDAGTTDSADTTGTVDTGGSTGLGGSTDASSEESGGTQPAWVETCAAAGFVFEPLPDAKLPWTLTYLTMLPLANVELEIEGTLRPFPPDSIPTPDCMDAFSCPFGWEFDADSGLLPGQVTITLFSSDFNRGTEPTCEVMIQ